MHPLLFTKKSQPGFTLIELLVVIAIIAVLAALSLPTINKVQASSKSTKCLSNLRQIGTAVLAYPIENNGDLPVDSGANFSAGADTLWFKLITPYIPTRSGSTSSVAVDKVLRCPAEKQPSSSVTGSICQYTAAYSMIANGSSRSSGPRKIIGITKPTTTFLIVDGVLLPNDYSSSSMAAWNSAIRPDLDAGSASSTQNISFRHKDSMNAVFADGHVGTVTWADRKNVITEYTWKGTSP
jgi:prepilin-type N-terminal cleavage/methylation domain-containing protein/prepilin-type processing-associated H-X9-DG protein